MMLDAEQRYDRRDAYRAAAQLETLGFTWFEAPLLDTDLEGYRDLRRRVNIPILPAGNWVMDPNLVWQGIRREAWTSVRVDANFAGGITPTVRPSIVFVSRCFIRGLRIRPGPRLENRIDPPRFFRTASSSDFGSRVRLTRWQPRSDNLSGPVCLF